MTIPLEQPGNRAAVYPTKPAQLHADNLMKGLDTIVSYDSTTYSGVRGEDTTFITFKALQPMVEGDDPKLEEIAGKYGLPLWRSIRETESDSGNIIFLGLVYSFWPEGRNQPVATVFLDEIKIAVEYEKGEQLFRDIVEAVYRDKISVGLVPLDREGESSENYGETHKDPITVLKGEVIREGPREGIGERYATVSDFESDVERLYSEVEPYMTTLASEGKLEPIGYEYILSLFKQVRDYAEKAKRSGFDIEGIRIETKVNESIKSIVKTEFYNSVGPLFAELENIGAIDTFGSVNQRYSTILQEILAAIGKAKERGVYDEDIKQAEQNAELISSTFMGLSSFASLLGGLEDSSQGTDKEELP